ncbi:MAG TPA: CYTH domain-containing protein [Candidatus Saccharimonadales bacterium]|nr:CYTH domain-containing protein [Candidatus Saccharimonadales bacterium]
MAQEIEQERTYLAAILPPEVYSCDHVSMRDVYFPASAEHAYTRVRQKNDKYEFTKKTATDPTTAGIMIEENVVLTREEFEALAKGDGRELRKTRYYMPYNGLVAEVDIFEGDLKGLVIIEFEFTSKTDMLSFEMPDFCLADVTEDPAIAGGILAGKTYDEIEQRLAQYGYRPL